MTEWTIPATIVRVHDGDTFIADLDLGWHVTLKAQSVRLAACNAAELSSVFVELVRDDGDRCAGGEESFGECGRGFSLSG